MAVCLLLDARTQFLPDYAVVDGLPDRSSASLTSCRRATSWRLRDSPKRASATSSSCPFTGKLTVLLDDTLSAAGAFGAPSQTPAWSSVATPVEPKWPLAENVTWTHRVDLFSDYLDSRATSTSTGPACSN